MVMKKIAFFDTKPYDKESFDRLLAESDIVSLHCPLLPETKHLINADTLAKAKRGFTLINTSRGGLVDSEALLSALRDGTVGAAGLDVYEEESEWFYEDRSDVTRQNKTLSLLVSLPNVFGRYAAEQDAVASRVAPQRDRHLAPGVSHARGSR